jgi:hypothetical protein
MARRKRTKEELKEASNHLNYEIMMLNSLANGLASGIGGQGPLQNALLESFAIHVRALIDFLYSEQAKNDAVIAEDYFNSPEVWVRLRPDNSDILKKARIRAHKEILHLTYERLKVTPKTKLWHFLEIREEINKIINLFLTNVDKEFLGNGLLT